MKLWQHAKTGELLWSNRELDPDRFRRMPVVCEEDLSTEMGAEEFAGWCSHSMVIDGVRFGPVPAPD